MYDVRTTSDEDSSQGMRFSIVYAGTGEVIETLLGYASVAIDGDVLVLTDSSGKVTRRPIASYFVRYTSESDNPYGYVWEKCSVSVVHTPTGVVLDTFTGSYTERPAGTSSEPITAEGVHGATIDGGELVLKDWNGVATRMPLPERALVSASEVVFGYADGRTVTRPRA